MENEMTAEIGARLRAARLAQGLSLRTVAQSLGVSASLISQVETGKTQPSVSTLYALVNHLGVSMDNLLGTSGPGMVRAGGSIDATPNVAVVQRASENPVLEMENGVRWERLAMGSGSTVDPLLVTYGPGASSSVDGKLMRHAGTEYAYILEGELTLQLEFDMHTLRAGDSLQFDSIRPHMYYNRSEQAARGIWFVIGRRAQHDAMPHATLDVHDGRDESAVVSSVDLFREMDKFAT